VKLTRNAFEKDPKENLFMWKIIVASVALIAGSVFAQPLPQERQEVVTRFGSLTVNDDKELLFKGRGLTPSVGGNNSLSLNDPIQMGEADVVLVQDNGGTGCPSLYYFVTVSRTGARATKAFGTCGDVTSVKKVGDSIRVTMPGFRGPFESESVQLRAARQRHVFIFRAGVVTQNGKPVK
jgi:hypothetical protein